MLKIDIICVGCLKKGPFFELLNDFQKRIQWTINIIELEAKTRDPNKIQDEEAEKILKHISPQAHVIAMDERGKSFKSIAFAKKLETFAHNGETHVQFIIGGADGLTETVRQKANLLISFGVQTWPHMMARVMLMEQIYRAQQILNTHPYHRE